MVVLHACIHAPMVRSQPKPKIVRFASCDRQHGIRQANIRIIEVNTRCATSDVNPFKIRCNLQIAKGTVNETQ